MRVALFLNKVDEPESGGTYSFERDLLTSLAKFENHTEHTFYVFGWKKTPPLEILKAPNIRYIFILSSFYSSRKIYKRIPKLGLRETIKSIGKKFLKFRLEEKKILRELLRYEIDVTWNWGLSCPVSQIPYVTTVWDLQHRLQPYFPEVTLKWNTEEKFYIETLQKASYVITGTKAGKAEVQDFYNVPEDRIKVIPFATPHFALNACPKKKKDLYDHYNIKASFLERFLIYPASFLTHKNHANLLFALKYLKDEFDIEISIIFTGADHGNLHYIKQLIANMDLWPQIYILGFVPLEDLASFYHHAFALTFVSLHGPDNLPPLEAFALGCPVIASNVPGSEEQLGEAALLIDSKDPKQIALAIKSLVDDPDLRESLIQKGRVRASQWNGQDYIREVCSILDEFASIRRCWGSSKFYF